MICGNRGEQLPLFCERPARQGSDREEGKSGRIASGRRNSVQDLPRLKRLRELDARRRPAGSNDKADGLLRTDRRPLFLAAINQSVIAAIAVAAIAVRAAATAVPVTISPITVARITI